MDSMEKQLLHLVFGGPVHDPQRLDFVDTSDLHIVGIYPNYAEAEKAWQSVSRKYIDYANIKYVIVHLHRMMEPDTPL